MVPYKKLPEIKSGNSINLASPQRQITKLRMTNPLFLNLDAWHTFQVGFREGPIGFRTKWITAAADEDLPHTDDLAETPPPCRKLS